jgi:hypothetical protein
MFWTPILQEGERDIPQICPVKYCDHLLYIAVRVKCTLDVWKQNVNYFNTFMAIVHWNENISDIWVIKLHS